VEARVARETAEQVPLNHSQGLCDYWQNVTTVNFNKITISCGTFAELDHLITGLSRLDSITKDSPF
jgi:hypothetical protein